jgi:hypothetical protein
LPDGAFKGLNWAIPSISSLRSAMREVAENRDDAARRGRNARALMVERYAPAVVADLVANRLRQINASRFGKTTSAHETEL